MISAVARVPVISVHHHTAASHPNIPMHHWGVSVYRSEGTGIMGTGTSQMGVTGTLR